MKRLKAPEVQVVPLPSLYLSSCVYSFSPFLLFSFLFMLDHARMLFHTPPFSPIFSHSLPFSIAENPSEEMYKNLRVFDLFIKVSTLIAEILIVNLFVSFSNSHSFSRLSLL